jgi:hypothetical protein
VPEETVLRGFRAAPAGAGLGTRLGVGHLALLVVCPTTGGANHMPGVTDWIDRNKTAAINELQT